MKKTIATVVIVVATFVAYSAWPFFGLYELGRAVQARDATRLEKQIDFPALRRSIAAQIILAHAKLTGAKQPSSLTVGLMSSVADPFIEKIVSPAALADLLMNGRWPQDVAVDQPALSTPLNWNALGSVWRLYAASDFGIGEVRFFLPVDVPVQQRFRAHLEIEGWTWKLAGLDLPAEMQDQLARALIKARTASR